MAKGTFQIISESYQIGAKNLFKYCRNAPMILKPFFYVYAIFTYVVLYISSFVFYILIVFDFLATIVNSIRKALLNSIETKSKNVQYSFSAFIFNPLIIAILTPIFILSAILPKISSEIGIDDTTGDILDNLDITGSGTFRKIINFLMGTISNLFVFIKQKNVLFLPFLILPYLFHCVIMLFLILISTPLLLLDLFSYIIDSIRDFCIRISRNLGKSTENGFWGFAFSPIILVFLVPVFIGILVIPKFSTGIDGAN